MGSVGIFEFSDPAILGRTNSITFSIASVILLICYLFAFSCQNLFLNFFKIPPVHDTILFSFHPLTEDQIGESHSGNKIKLPFYSATVALFVIYVVQNPCKTLPVSHKVRTNYTELPSP